jgi:hypothetical protein
MNVIYLEENPIIAKTCGCKEKNRQRVTYAFAGEFHSLCVDKKYIIQAEIDACERLLKYAINGPELAVIEKEITELKTVLDLMP